MIIWIMRMNVQFFRLKTRLIVLIFLMNRCQKNHVIHLKYCACSMNTGHLQQLLKLEADILVL